MPFTLTMPKLSPTMEEGTIAKWHKVEGDFVESGELLMEVATDKATVEHTAIDEGYLRKIIITEGGEAIVNQAIAIFTEQSDESIEGYSPEGASPPVPAEIEPVAEGNVASIEKEGKPVSLAGTTGIMQPQFVPVPPLENFDLSQYSIPLTDRIKASPVAKKIANEKGLDISSVKGTGPGGRVVKKDLEKAQSSGDFAFGRREIPTKIPGSYQEEKLSPIRKIVSRRLQESKTFIPHFYVTQTVSADALFEFRKQLRNLDLKVSFNDCVVRACALALRKYPVANSGFNTVNNTIINYETIDISVAVSMPEGLITPIVRHADYKNLGEISQEIRFLARRAKEGKLEAHEYQGGSFTVSNLGMYGVTDFKAIINPPQSCILAVGGILDVPVIKNGIVVPGKTMNITLSADHRVVDGVAAAEFVNCVKKYLENPSSLIV